ncbi:hypothetical protein GOP47_0018326 [Adiantum capillus-veneris]|uniref:Uncharacterized protein n=1 Tax=Adiantum capillus-veneris TaxID=13818 RepID=A0A9D4UH22_ADICA|nr:hypothetical protein GOP47_0018326 [Adiantum capillus-veneris]
MDNVAIHRGSNGYEIESESDLREDKEGLSEMYDPCCGDVYDLDVLALRKDLVRATQVWSLSEPDTGDFDSDSCMSHQEEVDFLPEEEFVTTPSCKEGSVALEVLHEGSHKRVENADVQSERVPLDEKPQQEGGQAFLSLAKHMLQRGVRA